MIIKSVKLHNIRTYLSQEVLFPEGTVLLSGDIGSGKSTLLLAIEFALFGISKGILSGEALLRHGKQTGYVELCFALEGREIVVQRNLKRMKDSIRQDEGFLMVDGMKRPCTAEELKAHVLELLGYPKELLKKSKGLIYRFTVYTPQEEMKHILFEDSEVRLDTLRRVFQVEKYKLVRENAQLILQGLREKKKELSARIEDLPQKQRLLDVLCEQLSIAEKKISAFQPMIDSVELLLKQKQDSLKLLEEKSRQLNLLKSQLAATSAVISEKKSSISKKESEISGSRKEIAKMKSELMDSSHLLANLSSRLVELNSYVDSLLAAAKSRRQLEGELFSLEQLRSEVDAELGRNEAMKSASQQLKKKIASIDTCPTCLQTVSGEHKHAIESSEDAKISDVESKSSAAIERKTSILLKAKSIKSELADLQSKERLAASLSSELKPYLELAASFAISIKPANSSSQLSVSEIQSSLSELNAIKKKLDQSRQSQLMISEKERLIGISEKAVESLSIESQILEGKRAEFSSRIASFGDTVAESSRLFAEVDSAIREKTALMVQKASFSKEAESVSLQKKQVSDEISIKEQARKELDEIANFSFWLDEMFLGLVSVIEKHVMMRIHQEFNQMFKDWFVLLMGNESMAARIDDEFTPVVEADGFEIPVENLSGGEKTSCALAYRLALNMVINNLVSTIKTKDLLILDEPTDGFSSEQLNKLNEVLVQLGLPQIIMVSHEDRIESFVQHIIRVKKDQHVSRIVV
jgi:DNA repair protein SbcC/Rad50